MVDKFILKDVDMRPLNINEVLYVIVEDEGATCDSCVFSEESGNWCNALTARLRGGKHEAYVCTRTKHYKQMGVEDIPNMKGKPIDIKLGN